MSDEEVTFDPPITLVELVEQARREDEAIAATVLLLRFLTTVKKRGVVTEPVANTLELFGLAQVDRELARQVPSGYLPCRLTERGEKVAVEMML